MCSMQKREITNHNDKYVVFFEFGDEQDALDGIPEPVEAGGEADDD